MSKTSLVNLLLGFSVITLAMCAGFFVALDAERAFLYDKSQLSSWQYVLMKSSHGHLSLFGLLHIAVGLSLPYASLSNLHKKLVTVGLGLGTLTMGVFLFGRSYMGPSTGIDPLGIIIGGFLSASIAALLLLCYGLSRKIMRF